ncbi:MAG: DUF2306 domain-containing protein [Pararhodobacter sp.]
MTTLAPLLETAPVVQLHVAAALISLALGPLVLFRRRRDGWHKTGGYVWIMAMIVTAVSSFWIHGFALIGPFGPIHLLSVLTLVALAQGLHAAVTRRIETHRRTMQALYFWALGVAGMFTLLPGRVMHRVLFPEGSPLGFAVVALSALMIWVLLRWRGRVRNPS